MAQLPPIKRFLEEDYSGIKAITEFASKLFYPLNLFLNAVYSALNNGLTLNANTIGMVPVQANITSGATGAATTTINWSYPQSPPKGVAIFACTSAGTAATLPLISWSYNAGVITVSMQFVTVTAGAIVTAAAATYSVTFWINGG